MQDQHPRRAGAAWALLGLWIIVSWFAGAVVVRIGLDWADTFPYSRASEWRYLGVAILALTVACTGTIVSIVRFCRARSRARSSTGPRPDPGAAPHQPKG